MSSFRRRAILLILPLLLLSTGCNQLTRPVTLPCNPAISSAAAERFEEKIQPLLAENGPPVFTVQASHDEVTSYLLHLLEEHPGESPVINPRVCFTPGQVHVAGRFVNLLPFAFDGLVVAVPRLVDGQPRLEIVRATAGEVSLPKPLLRMASQTANETIAEMRLGFRLTTLEIGDGQFTLSGQR